jgi:hypothetical protein
MYCLGRDYGLPLSRGGTTLNTCRGAAGDCSPHHGVPDSDGSRRAGTMTAVYPAARSVGGGGRVIVDHNRVHALLADRRGEWATSCWGAGCGWYHSSHVRPNTSHTRASRTSGSTPHYRQRDIAKTAGLMRSSEDEGRIV